MACAYLNVSMLQIRLKAAHNVVKPDHSKLAKSDVLGLSYLNPLFLSLQSHHSPLHQQVRSDLCSN